jgi:hypothetical protein
MVAQPPLEALNTDGRHCGWHARDHRMHFRQRNAGGYDTWQTRRASLFRVQCSVAPGNGRFSLVGAVAKRIRESGRMAYDYSQNLRQKDRD